MSVECAHSDHRIPISLSLLFSLSLSLFLCFASNVPCSNLCFISGHLRSVTGQRDFENPRTIKSTRTGPIAVCTIIADNENNEKWTCAFCARETQRSEWKKDPEVSLSDQESHIW